MPSSIKMPSILWIQGGCEPGNPNDWGPRILYGQDTHRACESVSLKSYSLVEGRVTPLGQRNASASLRNSTQRVSFFGAHGRTIFSTRRAVRSGPVRRTSGCRVQVGSPPSRQVSSVTPNRSPEPGDLADVFSWPVLFQNQCEQPSRRAASLPGRFARPESRPAALLKMPLRVWSNSASEILTLMPKAASLTTSGLATIRGDLRASPTLLSGDSGETLSEAATIVRKVVDIGLYVDRVS